MRGMFRNAILFNQNFQKWDISNVADMSYMFQNAVLFNQSLSWNDSNVHKMAYMFQDATNFNNNILQCDVSNIRGMYSMFARASSF
jgi:Mycoplasma protein of unknown function, DUF285